MTSSGKVLKQGLSASKLILVYAAVLSSAGAVGVIAAYEPILAVAVVGAIIMALVALAWPNGVTLAVMFLLYTNAAVVAIRFHGVPFIIGAAVPALLVIPLVNYLIFRREQIIVNEVLLLFICFLGVQLLSALFSIRVKDAFSSVINFAIEGMVLYFIILNIIRTPATLKRVIWMLLAAGALMGGLSLYQQITGTFDNNYGGFAQVTGAGFRTGDETLQGEVRQMRLSGPIGEKNYYAQVMLMLVPLGLFLLWSERSRFLRILIGIATTLAIFGVLLAFSRGSAVAFVLLLLIMVFLRYIKIYQLIIVLIGLVLLLQLMPQYLVRLNSLQTLLELTEEDSAGVAGADTSTQGRLGEMWAAGLVFAEHPILGVGPNLFGHYYEEYANRVGLRLHEGTREAHNLYLDVAAELGGAGLALFLIIVAVTLRKLALVRKQWLHTHPEFANIITGLLLAIISYLITGLFLSLAYERYFWLMLALAGAASYVLDQKTIAKTESMPKIADNAQVG